MGTLSDDMSRLVAIQVRQHQGGRAKELRLAAFGADGLGRVAKACGTTASVVEAWEAGEAEPTTQQALAWLMVLYGVPPGARVKKPQMPGQLVSEKAGRR